MLQAPHDLVGQARPRSPGSLLLRTLFVVGIMVAAAAAYLANVDSVADVASESWFLALLLVNLAVIAAIAALLGARVVDLLRENRETDGGARLRLRITFLFSLAAAIPTLIVTGFLAVMINRNVENWFSSFVEGGAAAARATVNDLVDEARAEVEVMRSDLAFKNAVVCSKDLAALEECTRLRSEYRGLFRRIDAYDRSGRVLFELTAEGAARPEAPAPADWTAAEVGEIRIKEDVDAIRIFFKAPNFDNVYLKAARSIPDALRVRLLEADQSIRDYKKAIESRRRYGAVVTLIFVEAALLMLLGTAWVGMTAAARIAGSVGQLAQAARAVRDGDLSVRAPRPAVRDEIDDLADAFNQMTERLFRQRAALDQARIDAETRTAFIEAVLSGVEAGVVRVDNEMAITIANASARTMLGFELANSRQFNLSEIAPEFAAAALRAIETGQSVEATVRRASRTIGPETRHFQVRAAPEPEKAGAVVTFNDTTRLVLGQRQAAWRDVARRIAHEIRNPLTPIQLSAERLRRRFASQIETDRETFIRCTDTITRQVNDLGRMVEEFSGFAQMPKPTIGEFDLVELVQSVAFAQRMTTPQISVGVQAPLAKLPMWGDERLLGQALANLLKNGAEAVERRIGVDAEQGLGALSIEIREQAHEAELIIRDNGAGFPVEDRERLLEPYVTTRKNGVGLGLAIVSRIIEDHGGRIRLADNDSAPVGAQVEIRLPRQPHMSGEFMAYAGEGAA